MRPSCFLAALCAIIPAAVAVGQITELSALRTVQARVEGGEESTARSVDFGAFVEAPAVAGQVLGGFTNADASQTSSIPTGGPYTGDFRAHASILQGLARETVQTRADSRFTLSLDVDVPSVLRVRGSLGSARLGDASRAFVEITVTDDSGSRTLAGGQTAMDLQLYDVRIDLDPGSTLLQVIVSAEATLVEEAGRADASAACLLTATLAARPLCLCERAGDLATIDVLDLLEFVAAWLGGDSSADLDDGGVAISDLLLFLECWLPASAVGGCS